MPRSTPSPVRSTDLCRTPPSSRPDTSGPPAPNPPVRSRGLYLPLPGKPVITIKRPAGCFLPFACGIQRSSHAARSPPRPPICPAPVANCGRHSTGCTRSRSGEADAATSAVEDSYRSADIGPVGRDSWGSVVPRRARGVAAPGASHRTVTLASRQRACCWRDRSVVSSRVRSWFVESNHIRPAKKCRCHSATAGTCLGSVAAGPARPGWSSTPTGRAGPVGVAWPAVVIRVVVQVRVRVVRRAPTGRARTVLVAWPAVVVRVVRRRRRRQPRRSRRRHAAATRRRANGRWIPGGDHRSATPPPGRCRESGSA